MKIIIDARMYGLEHTGIGRYILNLIDQIDKINAVEDKFGKKISNQYLILLRKKYFDTLEFKSKNIRKVLSDIPHYSLGEQIFLPIQLFKLKPDLVHFPHFNLPWFYFGKYVVTIHDLIKHQSKGMRTTTRSPLTYWFKQLLYFLTVWIAIKKAFKIITPSKWWQERLTRSYNLPIGKVLVTYEGVDNRFNLKGNRDVQKILKKFKIRKPFVIYTGSLYPHKNVDNLLKAVVLVNKKLKQKMNLVIVCSRNVFWQRFLMKVKKLKADNFVNLVGFVQDEELVSLYTQARAFVFPSLLEGFGLPGLEAMAVGLPVIASDASCLPEIYGQAALYFEPLDANQIAEKIVKVDQDDSLRKKLIEAGEQKVRQYSWNKMALKTIDIYNGLNN